MHSCDEAYTRALNLLTDTARIKDEMHLHLRFLCYAAQSGLSFSAAELASTHERIDEALDDLFYETVLEARCIRQEWERRERLRACDEWKRQ